MLAYLAAMWPQRRSKSQARIKTVELTLRREIEQVRVEIVRTKNDLLKWLVPLMFGQVVAIAALVKSI